MTSFADRRITSGSGGSKEAAIFPKKWLPGSVLIHRDLPELNMSAADVNAVLEQFDKATTLVQSELSFAGKGLKLDTEDDGM